jgi:hypothetical protein
MTEPDAPVRWGIAAAWAVPIALWLSVIAVVSVALPWQWHEWRTNVSLWPPAIAESRARGDDGLAARQEAWLERDQRNGLLTVVALGAVLILALAAPFAIRRLVPRRRRAGLRGFLLAVPALVVLALAGYLVLAALLQGTIKG